MSNELPVFSHWYDAVARLLDQVSRFPRNLRPTLGHRLIDTALNVLESIVEIRYTRAREPLFREVNLMLEKLRVLSRTALRNVLNRIVRAKPGTSCGLPIGSLTSQWFANLYLGRIDAFVRHRIRPLGYLRYMDDFALFHSTRAAATEARHQLAYFVTKRLGLDLNHRITAIYRTMDAWPFLGFRVRQRGLRLRRETWQRFKKRTGADWHDYRRGRISAAELRRATESRLAHLARAKTGGLRRKEVRLNESI